MPENNQSAENAENLTTDSNVSDETSQEKSKMEEPGIGDQMYNKSISDDNNSNEAEVSWYVTEGVPGTGEPPIKIQDKFKGDLSKQAQAYNELESRFGGFVGAPEEYDLSAIEKHGIQLDPEGQETLQLIEMGKENKVSQEFMNKLLDTYGARLSQVQSQFKKPTNVEIASQMGDEGKDIFDAMDKFVSENFTDDEKKTIEGMVASPECVHVLNKMRKMTVGKTQINLPNPGETRNLTKDPRESVEAIQHEMIENAKKFKTNPAYQKELLERMQRALK